MTWPVPTGGPPAPRAVSRAANDVLMVPRFHVRLHQMTISLQTRHRGADAAARRRRGYGRRGISLCRRLAPPPGSASQSAHERHRSGDVTVGTPCRSQSQMLSNASSSASMSNRQAGTLQRHVVVSCCSLTLADIASSRSVIRRLPTSGVGPSATPPPVPGWPRDTGPAPRFAPGRPAPSARRAGRGRRRPTPASRDRRVTRRRCRRVCG